MGIDVNKNALALARENAVDIIDPDTLSQNTIAFKEHSYSELKELNSILLASSKFFVYFIFSLDQTYTNSFLLCIIIIIIIITITIMHYNYYYLKKIRSHL